MRRALATVTLPARALLAPGAGAAPKVIRVLGDIEGHEADDGTPLGEQDYAPGYDLRTARTSSRSPAAASPTATRPCSSAPATAGATAPTAPHGPL